MSDFGAKGKGKGKGKGKAASPEGGKGHLLEKTRLSAEKFIGTVVSWKGKYGWIKPAEEIEHEKASLHNGNLFTGIDDLIGVTELEAGAPVEFHICEDESGLGAEEVVQTGAGDPSAAPAPKGKGKIASKGSAKGSWGGSAYGGGKADGGWKGDWGGGGYSNGAKGGYSDGAKGKGWSLSTGAPMYSGSGITPPAWSGKNGKISLAKGAGKGMDKGFDKGKGKEKGKGKSGGKGHTLPRTRITAEKFTGTVSAWKGKYGWITPHEPVEHEKASKHNGSLFVGKDDLEGATELAPDSTVEFHIWEDASGLGADEVVVQG